jgi:hypothetical protein
VVRARRYAPHSLATNRTLSGSATAGSRLFQRLHTLCRQAVQRQLDEQLGRADGGEAKTQAVALLGATFLRAAAESHEAAAAAAPAATVLVLLLQHATVEHNWVLAYLASLAPVLALRTVAQWAAHGDTLKCARPLHGDAKVANREIRVWHGATENGP